VHTKHSMCYKHQAKSNTTFKCFIVKVFLFTERILGTNYMFRPFNRPSSGWSFVPYEATIQYAISS